MKIRRECEGREKTHLGKILNGVRLEDDFRPGTEICEHLDPTLIKFGVAVA